MKTKEIHFVVSGRNIEQGDLFDIAIGGLYALGIKYHSPLKPVVVKNAPDCIFGKSYDIIYKVHEKPTEGNFEVN